MKPMKGRKIDVTIKGGKLMAGIFGACLLTHAGLSLAESEIPKSTRTTVSDLNWKNASEGRSVSPVYGDMKTGKHIKNSGSCMKFIVLFEDNGDKSHMREAHMKEHLSFLKKNESRIISAGPLFEAENSLPAGGAWLIDADNVDTVNSLIKSDPFWPTGLRKHVRILRWKQVFSNGEQHVEKGC